MASFLSSIISSPASSEPADNSKNKRTPGSEASVAQYNAKCNSYELRVVLSGLPLCIESLCGYDNKLLVGTKEGHLLIYEVVIETGFVPPKPVGIHITHSNKHFSKKPILQLGVIPEHHVLISLTGDNGISVHDMALYQCPSIATIERTKGATLFSLDIQRQKSLTGNPTITVRMCVVVGKRLQLFYWKNRSFHDLRDDFYTPDTPRAITWCTETLCIGFKNEYITLSLLSGETSELCSAGRLSEPIITKISDDRFALVRDKKCILKKIDEEGVELRIWTEWTEVPTAIVFDEPYIIGIHSGKIVEVRTANPKLLVGSFPLPSPTVKLLTKSNRGTVYIASNDVVWCLKSTPIDAQIDAFIKQQHFKLALSLANISDAPEKDKEALVSKIQMTSAIHLFCRKNFEEAMKIFEKLETDVPQVIGMFPNLLPPEMQQKMVYNGKLPELEGSDLEKGLTALQGFLTHMRVKYVRNMNQSNNDPTTVVEGTIPTMNKRILLQIIDTTLLKCYLKTKESLVASLLRLKENYCHYEETEKILKKENKIDELIILYNTKGEHRKALTLLQQQNNIPATIDYLQNLGMEHVDIILDYSKNVLLSNPEDGLKIFTEDYPEVESLPRAKVYDFLERNFRNLAIPYLRHLIFDWKETNPLFHNALIHHYREQAMSERDPDVAGEAKEQLLEFLKTSTHYTAETVIIHFPYSDLYEERALLLERLGRHEQALSIYVTLLKDRQKALEYCHRVYRKGDKARKEIYTILMRMLLNPPTTKIPGIPDETDSDDVIEPDLPAAIALLHDFAPCIEPSKALLCLPDDVSVRDIQNFLKTSIQNYYADKRKLLLTKGLAEAEYRKAVHEKAVIETEKFVVLESAICGVCGKRIANQRIFSAFARYPNGSIVHYMCQSQKQGSV